MQDEPSVTIAIPTYNEAAFIEKTLTCFLLSGYQRIVEIMVCDGGSRDGTQGIVERMSLEDRRIKLLHNPMKIQSSALNIMIEKSVGDIFLRADAHGEYSNDYVQECVRALIETKACNVGGAQRFVARNVFQLGVALSVRSYMGSGGARYRDPLYSGPAETVFLGCFWRRDLVDVGGYSSELMVNEDSELNRRLMVFNESQVTNQDAELNYRLGRRNGRGGVYVLSSIKCWYYPRDRPAALIKQYFKYGRGRGLNVILNGMASSPLRSYFPFVFLFLALISFAILLSLSMYIYLVIIPICIGIIIGMEAARCFFRNRAAIADEIWRGNGRIPDGLSVYFSVFLAMIIMPLAHSVGMCYQFIRAAALRKKAW